MRWLKTALVALLWPGLLPAQLALFVVEDAAERPLPPNALFPLGVVAAGQTQTVRLRVRNVGSQPETITLFVVEGAGFSLNRPLPPQTVAPGGILNATLTFSASMPANYSAHLRLNGTSILLLATVAAGASLSVPPGCQGATAGAIDFGFVARGRSRTCAVSLRNDTAQAVTISTITVTGAGFGLEPVSLPLTLLPGQSATVGVRVTAGNPGVLQGTLRVEARDYALAAVATEAPLPAPGFEFDPGAFLSAQQRRLALRLTEPAPFTGTGFVNLEFRPDGLAAADDPAIRFLETGTRQARFQVTAGQTAVTIEGAPAISFQTGTTAGRIRVFLSGIPSGFQGSEEVSLNIAPAPVALDRTIAARFPERLEVTLYGFDNTFSAGAMNFQFFDAAGGRIATIPADFAAAFRAFFGANPGGSMFKMTATFLVNGGTSKVAAVEVELANAAGTTRTPRLNFQ
jgi:hypothetical protein